MLNFSVATETVHWHFYNEDKKSIKYRSILVQPTVNEGHHKMPLALLSMMAYSLPP